MTLDLRLDPDQGFDRGAEAITHEFEFTVGRDERYSAIVFETGETDALVEFDVFHFDGFSAGGAACGFEHDFVVESETEFGHSGEVAFHFDGAEDF